jgi:membrane protease YdiL (CAAX protease family)
MISAKPWTVEAVVRLFLGVLMTLCFGTMAAGLLESFKLGLGQETRHFLQTVTLVACFQGAAFAWVAVLLKQSNITWSEAFGLRPPSIARAILTGLAVGILVLPAVWFLQMGSQTVMEWIGLKPSAQEAVRQLQDPSLTLAQKLVLGVFTILIAPAAEETLFRGIIYPTIKQSGHPRWALWGTSLLFGAVHADMAIFVPLVMLAVVLTLLYEASGSLLTPIATHGMFNAANFLFLILPNSVKHTLHLT